MKKIKKGLVCLMIVSLSCILLSACDSSKTTKDKKESNQTQETTTFKDSLGRKVEVPDKISRYAVTGSMAQIVCFAADPDGMVGLSEKWSEDAKEYIDKKYLEMPYLGQLFGGKGELNLEELINSDPQVIIDVGDSKKDISGELDDLQKKTGIPVVHFTVTLDNAGDAFTAIGKLLDKEEVCEELAGYCDMVYKRTQDMIAKIGQERKSILYCLGDTGCNVISSGTYQSAVLDLLGNNVAMVENPSPKGSGDEVNFEQILKWDPAYLFVGNGSIYSDIKTDSNWQQLTAVKEGKYYEVPKGVYDFMGFPPSVQRYMGMMWMENILYPDKVTYNLQEDVTEFYDRFLHCDLSDVQYDNLMANSINKE